MMHCFLLLFSLFWGLTTSQSIDFCEQKNAYCDCPDEQNVYAVVWLNHPRLIIKLQALQEVIKQVGPTQISQLQNPYLAHLSVHYFCCLNQTEKAQLYQQFQWSKPALTDLTFNQLSCNREPTGELMLHLTLNSVTNQAWLTLANNFQQALNRTVPTLPLKPLSSYPQLHVTVARVTADFPLAQLWSEIEQINLTLSHLLVPCVLMQVPDQGLRWFC